VTAARARCAVLAVAAAALILPAVVGVSGPVAASASTATTSLPVAIARLSPQPLAIRSARLGFRPPTLVRPITIAVRDNMGDLKLDVGRDYRIVLPRGRAWVNSKGLSIAGGHNVIVVGGLVDVRDGYLASGKATRRAAYIRNSTGTVFVEGVRFVSSTAGSLTEGVDLSCPSAAVVLQNVALGSILAGSQSTNHADAIQSWAGPARLFIDGFTATTRYQGFFLLPQQHSSSAVSSTGWDFRRVFLRGIASGYLLWRDNGSYPIRTSEVYVVGSPKQSSGMWPNRTLWRFVKVGVPARMFATTAGSRYVSPGYA
jgi:hypothetical protein